MKTKLEELEDKLKSLQKNKEEILNEIVFEELSKQIANLLIKHLKINNFK